LSLSSFFDDGDFSSELLPPLPLGSPVGVVGVVASVDFFRSFSSGGDVKEDEEVEASSFDAEVSFSFDANI